MSARSRSPLSSVSCLSAPPRRMWHGAALDWSECLRLDRAECLSLHLPADHLPRPKQNPSSPEFASFAQHHSLSLSHTLPHPSPYTYPHPYGVYSSTTLATKIYTSSSPYLSPFSIAVQSTPSLCGMHALPYPSLRPAPQRSTSAHATKLRN